MKLSGKWNCAQSVACIYCSDVNCPEDTMAAMGAAFGTGMGCLEGTCGALVGAGLVLGLHHGGNRPAAMKAMRRVMDKFQAATVQQSASSSKAWPPVAPSATAPTA